MTVTQVTQFMCCPLGLPLCRQAHVSQAHKECIHKVTRNALLLVPHLVMQHYHSQAHKVINVVAPQVVHIYGGNITRMNTRDRRGRLPSGVYGFEASQVHKLTDASNPLLDPSAGTAGSQNPSEGS